ADRFPFLPESLRRIAKKVWNRCCVSRIADSSSRNAVSFSSARITKRLQPSLRYGQHCSLSRWIQTALSNSKNAVRLSSACTTNRFPSSRCAFGALENRWPRSEEHTSELQSLAYLVCRLLLEKKNKK